MEAEVLNYDEAVSNLESYALSNPQAKNDITLHYGLAENFTITAEDNIFYFFNPFDISVFKVIYKNIIASLKKYPRDVTLLVYYSIPEYVNFLSKSKHFQLLNKFNIPTQKDQYQQILIYKHHNLTLNDEV